MLVCYHGFLDSSLMTWTPVSRGCKTSCVSWCCLVLGHKNCQPYDDDATSRACLLRRRRTYLVMLRRQLSAPLLRSLYIT